MSTPANNEEVYCHACSNRWRRDEHGLDCPRCGSDVVEIVDPDNDPAHDFDDSDNDSNFPHSPSDNPFAFPFPPRSNNGPGPNPLSPFGALFSLMSQTPGSPPPGASNPGTRVWTFSSPSGTTRLTATTSISMGGGPRSPGPAPNPPQLQVLESILSDIIGGPASPRGPGSPGMTGGPGRPPDAILGLMNALLAGPHQGRMGDVAWSQEEFDRIITQLMEQNQGTAPGPASQEAISSLPKKVVDASMVGESGKAECTICMDDVQIGDRVTELYCKHWFHTNCITVWLNEHNTCPHCRMGIEDAKQKAEQGEGGDSGEGGGKGGKRPYGSGNNAPGPSGGGSGSSRPSWIGDGPSANTRSRSNHSIARSFGLYDRYRPPTPPINRSSRPRRSMRMNSDNTDLQSSRTRHLPSRSPSATASGPTTPLSVPELGTESNDVRTEALLQSLQRAETSRQRRRHSTQVEAMYPNYREEYRPPTPPLGRRSSRRSSVAASGRETENWNRDREFEELVEQRASRRRTREVDDRRRAERERERERERGLDRERERDRSHPTSRPRRTSTQDATVRPRRRRSHQEAETGNSNMLGHQQQQTSGVVGFGDRVRSWFGGRS